MNKNPKKFSNAWNFGPTTSNAKTVNWILNKLLKLLAINISIISETKENKFLETKYLKLDSKKAKQLETDVL